VTTLQAVALLAFSSPSVGPLSFAALSDGLGMGDEVLKRVMHSLSCGKFKVRQASNGASSDLSL